MAVIQEKLYTLNGNASTRRVGYLVTEANDDQDAWTLTRATAAGSLGGFLTLTDIEVEELDLPEYGTQRAMFNTWAVYEHDPYPIDSKEAIANFGVETRKIFRSRSTKERRTSAGGPIAGNSIDYQRFVNIDEKGNARGEDVLFPIGSLEVRFYPSQVQATDQTWRNKVLKRVTHVNSATFEGFAPGEVIFMGMTMQPVERYRRLWYDTPLKIKWEVLLTFGIRENEPSKSVGNANDTIAINKDGWELDWTKNELRQVESTDSSQKYTVPWVVQANVEEFYVTSDLNEIYDA